MNKQKIVDEKDVRVKLPNGRVVKGLLIAKGRMSKHDSKLWDCAFNLGEKQATASFRRMLDDLIEEHSFIIYRKIWDAKNIEVIKVDKLKELRSKLEEK